MIASARSAYFEVENYAAQSRLLKSLPDTHVTMNLVRLERWSRNDAITYFKDYRSDNGGAISDPASVYDERGPKI